MTSGQTGLNMKRAIVILLATALLGILSPALPILAQPHKIPHENPETARETRIEDDLLLTFSDVIDLAAESQYSGARERLEELRRVSIPPDIDYLIDQYGDLYQRVLVGLDDLEGQLNEISSLLKMNRTEEARELLESADLAITERRNLVNETEAATRSLDEKFGALSGLLPDDPIAQAYDHLQLNVGRLTDIVNNYDTLQQKLSERHAELSKLTPVDLSLEIDSPSAFVGDPVKASGWLRSGGQPLPGRTVDIVTGNNTLATVVTSRDGSYETNFSIPYEYSNETSFVAAYGPGGDDAAVFLGAQSEPFIVNTRFYPAVLNFSLPEAVYPGHPFTLNVGFSPNEDPAERTISVTLDGSTLVNTSLPTGESFSMEVMPPPGTPAGVQHLEVAVPPKGRYAGATVIRRINVAMMNVRIKAETPAIILLPRDINIRGAVENGPGPLSGAPVDISLNALQVAAVTAPDGTFQAVVPVKMIPAASPLAGNPFYLNAGSSTIPFNIWPIGWQDLEITTSVPGSLFGTFKTKKSVVSVNPLTSGLLVAVFAGAWIFVFRKQKLPAPMAVEAESTVTALPAQVALLPAPARKLTGLSGRVLAAYSTGLAAVEKTTGAVMGSNITLREYRQNVTLPTTNSRVKFTELTDIAETTLYSRNTPNRDTVVHAEELANTIKEDLEVGTT